MDPNETLRKMINRVTGHVLTERQVRAVAEALDNSTVPEVIADVAYAVVGDGQEGEK